MKDPKNQKGFLLISSYLVLSSLMTLSLALWMRGVGMLGQYESTIYQMEAFHLAESALDIAITNLEQDLSYAGTGSTTYTKNGRLIGTYSAAIETPDAGNPLRKRIVATGSTPDLDGNGRGVTTRTIESFVDLIEPPVFDFAVFAKQNITLSGSSRVIIDSYDSALGPYDSATAFSNADVVTNGTLSGAISLSGEAQINGDASVGPGADPATAISVGSNSTITGTTSSAISSKTYDSVTVPGDAVAMGHVSLSSKNALVLDGGTYVFDSLSITGQSSLTFNGPAVVYLQGDAYIGGNGVMTNEARPRNLVIHVEGSHGLDYAGNGSLHAAIYAPDAQVDVSGNGAVYGAVIADTYDQHGNGAFHYDEDLKRQDPDAVFRAEIVSWRENDKFLG